MEDQLDIMRSIRKKMPRPTRIVNPERDEDKNWDWRKEMSKGEDNEETDN